MTRKDARLEAAIAELETEIEGHPIPQPKVPACPTKGGSQCVGCRTSKVCSRMALWS